MLSKALLHRFARCSNLAIPKIDLSRYLARSVGWEDDCRQVASLMHLYGLVYVFDPRVDHSDN